MNETDDVSERARARVGTVLRGKWHLDRILGIGGTACVYAATHRNRSRVAIKVLHAEFAANKSIVTRFLREGYVGNAVSHPGTVRILDDDTTEDGEAFLVMELLDGETLGDRVERLGRLPPYEVAAIGIQLLDVLAAAHAQNIVHRDLKPDNVFVTRTGQLKVLDFGIARLREAAIESNTGTLQGSLLGTPGFMAPEQALGRWNEVDGRTDLWAVGATLFTILTGRFAHEADSVQEQLVMAATRQATRVTAALPDTPSWLAEIIDRAMAFDAAERYPDAYSMKDALVAACDGVDLPPLSVPDKPVSIIRTPQFPDSVTRAADGHTIAGVQSVARSAAHEKPRGRGKTWILAAVVAAFGGAFVLSSVIGKTGPEAEPVASSKSPASATIPAPSKAPARSTTIPAPSAEGALQAGGVVAPASLGGSRPPETTEAHVPTVTPAARLAPVPSAKITAEARRKPPKTPSKKPPEAEKPGHAENPFDTRH